MSDLNPDQVLHQLREEIRGIRKLSKDLTRETNLVGDEVLDSLDFIDYVFQVQEEFGIKIPDEDLETQQLGNMGNMVDYLLKKKSQ